MAIQLPPDPYKALGVEPTASYGDIRKVYLKLVLKCHPDKIQDPELHAQKTDEFHKIQEAWDLLSDKSKRATYDEDVILKTRQDAASTEGSGAPRQARTGGYPSPTPAGYNAYATANANVFTAEPRNRDSRRRRSPSPTPFYAQHSTKTRSYEDELASHYYDEEPRMSKSTSAANSGRKPTAATLDRDRERGRRDDDRERERDRERYEKDKKKKEYASSQKSRDREKRSRTEEKSGKKSAFVRDASPEEYDSRDHRPSRQADRGVDALPQEFGQFHITKGKQQEDFATQYISTAKSKGRNGLSAEVKTEEFRPRNMQRAETFSTYPVPQQRSYYDDGVIPRSSARTTSRRPSADAASPQSSDPMSPHIVDAEPKFARKPSLQHYSSAPPIFPDGLPTRAQTMETEPSRRSSAGTVPPAPRRAETFSGSGKFATSSPLKQSYRPTPHYSSGSASSDSDAAQYSRPKPQKRPSITKKYKIESRDTGEKFTTVVEETPAYGWKGSSSPSRQSSDKPSISSRYASGTRPKLSGQSSSRHREEQPSVRVTPREVPGRSKTGEGSYFGEISNAYGEVKYAQYAEPLYTRYDDKRSGSSSNMSGYAYYAGNRRSEAVN